LDYKDPKTLKKFILPPLIGKNLFPYDFFSEKTDDALRGKCFDFIIGNPPWGRIDGSHATYCKARRLPLQNGEISRSFTLRARDFSNAGTCCCFIITSKLMYNTGRQATEYRKWMLEHTQIEKYIELAAVRELLFSNAMGPAGVLIYRFCNFLEKNMLHVMRHVTLMPNKYFKLFHIIVVEKNDHKALLNNKVYLSHFFRSLFLCGDIV
jgi:hypothetical protein